MRARLAGGQNGGVNSPEGAEKLTPALVAPRTEEVNGVTQPLSTEQPAAPAAESSTAAPAELTRGQKAAATRAANKAKVAAEMAAPNGVAPSVVSTTQEAGPPAPAAASAASAGAGFDLPPGAIYIPPPDPYAEIKKIQLDAIKVQVRIAIALEALVVIFQGKEDPGDAQ